MTESGWEEGCFCLRAANVESLDIAMVTIEQATQTKATRTNLLKSPSSIFKATREASSSFEPRGLDFGVSFFVGKESHAVHTVVFQ